MDGEELAAVRERARADGFEVRAVPAEMARSSTYRRDFLAVNPGPHRCRYCRRRLGEGELTVDHLVPVALAQRSATARALLSLIGAEEGVNDPANLVPACPRCNSRKWCKGGLWILRWMLGRHRAYWILLLAAQAAAIAVSRPGLLAVNFTKGVEKPFLESVAGLFKIPYCIGFVVIQNKGGKGKLPALFGRVAV